MKMRAQIIFAAFVSSGLICSVTVAQSTIMYVEDGTACTDCQTCGAAWGTAFDEISDAIACASTQDTVELWVAEGTYGPIALRDNMKIIGGFEGDETSASESDPHRNRSIITGGTHLVLSTGNDSTAVLRGFYIQNGGTTVNFERGPGLYLQAFSSPIIADCVFRNNFTTYAGGAVLSIDGYASFVNCQFRNNDGGLAPGDPPMDVQGAPNVSAVRPKDRAQSTA